jgi:hypothetical protein
MYQDVTSRRQIAPEEEFWKSVYISGASRTNHKGIVEVPGKLQIRGFDYNLSEVYMAILFIKQILVKEVPDPNNPNQTRIECFSYRKGNPPYFGTSGLQCGKNSQARAAVEYCRPCRSNLIVAGLLTKPDGDVILDESGKPVFIFIRAKGIKYGPVNEYLSEIYQAEPLLHLVSSHDDALERSSVNTRRFLTRIRVGKVPTRFGDKDCFHLEKVKELDKEQIQDLLKMATSLVSKFDQKFDWSQNMSSGYIDSSALEDTPPQEIVPPIESETSRTGPEPTPPPPTPSVSPPPSSKPKKRGLGIDIDAMIAGDDDIPF